MKHGKKYVEAAKVYDKQTQYDRDEAVAIVKKLATAKFDETIEAHIRTGCDGRHADQQIRGAVVLPHGTGKKVRILVFAKDAKAEEAKAAGADFVGGEELIPKIQNENWFEFDVVVATPDMMGVVGRLGRVLGPKGLMPNPKAGTVTMDVTKAINDIKAGKIEYSLDKTNIIHVPVGKASFTEEQLADNFQTLIDAINKEREAHIITLEDPIEYLHRNQKSLISQREIAIDTENYLTGLRACLRQAPDVILLGEMRDAETIRTAMTAAETGHLVIATLHTKGAVNTIDRIVDSFPADQQDQIKIQLSLVLDCIVSQQLLQREGGGMIPAVEIMKIVPAIQNMIRDSKNYQIDNVIQTSGELGMVSMDQYILKLYRKGEISEETALLSAINPEQLKRKLSR